MTVRFGILGTARIAPLALVRPARRVSGCEVTAVASRSRERARKWASKHRVPNVHGSYEELLADPAVNAVYIPLPNALHAEWVLRAIDAGKHVLCEKPLATDEQQAKELAAAARASGLACMEAFHYRYHPLMDRIVTIVRSQELGELRQIDATMSVPVLMPRDIRWDADLGGGATMDVGCYLVDLARHLGGPDPDVLTASGALTRGGVDRSFEATLAFAGVVEARIRGSILGPPWARLRVTCTRGDLDVLNPILPQLFYRLRVSVDAAERRETVSDGGTYAHQLEHFVRCVEEGMVPRTSFEDAVSNHRVLDQIRVLIGITTPWDE